MDPINVVTVIAIILFARLGVRLFVQYSVMAHNKQFKQTVNAWHFQFGLASVI